MAERLAFPCLHLFFKHKSFGLQCHDLNTSLLSPRQNNPHSTTSLLKKSLKNKYVLYYHKKLMKSHFFSTTNCYKKVTLEMSKRPADRNQSPAHGWATAGLGRRPRPAQRSTLEPDTH